MADERANTQKLCYAKVLSLNSGNLPCSIDGHSGTRPPAVMSRTRDALGIARKGIPSGQQLGNSDTCRRTSGALVAHSNRSPAISGQSWFVHGLTEDGVGDWDCAISQQVAHVRVAII